MADNLSSTNGVSSENTNGYTKGHPTEDFPAVNGTSINGSNIADTIPTGDLCISAEISRFVADTTYESLKHRLLEKLKELLLDHIGVASNAGSNAESSAPFLKAILEFGGTATGTSTVYGKGHGFAPQYAVLLNAAFAHTFDFDDTYAAGGIHPGASVIPAALIQSESSGADGKTLLTALAVGLEVICRLARALGTTPYDRGFHNTGTAGIFGAIAAISKVKNLPSYMVQTAFGIAGSKAAGSMSFMQDGSWNKRLHPGFAAHDAFLCVAIAEAGVKGSPQPFEGKGGFLHAYSEKPIIEGLVDRLGEEWVFLHTALKPYPSCRATHTSIELAAKMSKLKDVPIESITIALSRLAWGLVGVPQPNKIRPENIVDAQFSNYAQTAIAWIYGSDLGWASYDKIYEPKVQHLATQVRCIVDEDQPELGAKMTVRWQDGSVCEEAIPYPLGEAENPFVSEKVQAKYLSLTRSIYGIENAVRILDVVLALERHDTLDLMSLL